VPEIFPVEASITGIKVPSIQTKKIKLLKSQQIYQTKHTHKQKQKLLKILEEPQESPTECVSESISLSHLTMKATG
jgi:hypothetical protein